jgi:translation initiation factor 1
MAKKKKERYTILSEEEDNNHNLESLSPNEQVLRVFVESKNRGGKTATIIRDFIGSDDDLKDLGKIIKSKCSTGGSVKDGEIIIQGNVRDKVIQLLTNMDYKVKRVGG